MAKLAEYEVDLDDRTTVTMKLSSEHMEKADPKRVRPKSRRVANKSRTPANKAAKTGGEEPVAGLAELRDRPRGRPGVAGRAGEQAEALLAGAADMVRECARWAGWP